MNKKCVFTGNKWIVTSGEIEITPPHGTRPMHPVLSKKLYDQNIVKYSTVVSAKLCYITSIFNAFDCTTEDVGWVKMPILPSHDDIDVTITTINKYTIVELTHYNKHYHGLASRADCDNENAITGIAEAYHRAFKTMVENQK